jgi:hypothetical protein
MGLISEYKIFDEDDLVIKLKRYNYKSGENENRIIFTKVCI